MAKHKIPRQTHKQWIYLLPFLLLCPDSEALAADKKEDAESAAVLANLAVYHNLGKLQTYCQRKPGKKDNCSETAGHSSGKIVDVWGLVSHSPGTERIAASSASLTSYACYSIPALTVIQHSGSSL